MTEKIQKPRGTRDIFGYEAELLHDIESNCRELFSHYGYREIITPSFEVRSLFERSVGDETDIVSKELYGWTDSKDKSFALRPEGTAGAVRAFIENNFAAASSITKLFYVGQMFRHERPQEGRFREFWQTGCELFGSSSIYADAEIIDLSMRILERLSIPAKLKINHLGCDNCRENFSSALVEHFTKSKDKLCESCIRRLAKNPLRLLDCKSPVCGQVIAESPLISLCSECSKAFNLLKELLSDMRIKFSSESRLVRGLDYYTGIVFEAVSNELGSQDAVLGGGRYDKLVKSLGGAMTPAVGFALGLDRTAILMKIAGEKITNEKPFIYIIGIGENGERIASQITKILRRHFENMTLRMSTRPEWIEQMLVKKSLKAGLREADKLGASYAVIIGDDEISKSRIIIRDMSVSQQIEVNLIFSDESIVINEITSAIQKLVETRQKY